MIIQPNPFYYGGPIKDTRYFVNRKQEVMEIYEAIMTAASVSVVGERRVGKSSLLRYLADSDVIREHGLDPGKYIFADIEFQGLATITQTEFWRQLLGKPLSQLHDLALAAHVQALRGQETIKLVELQQLFEAFEKASLNLVLILDEFDTAARNPNFDLNFFGGLRNLSNFRMSFIIASQRTLSDLGYAHPDAIVSPFFNIFRRITLRGFAVHEVQELLRNTLKHTGVYFTGYDRKLLSDLASTHPFFLQMAASYLFNAYRYDSRPNQRKENIWVTQRFLDNSIEHFRYYWERSEAGEKLILATLSLLEAEELERYKLYPNDNDPMFYTLQNRVLVVTDQQGQWRIFSSVFEQWIHQTLSFVPIDQVDDFKAAVDEAKASAPKKIWLDSTERLRKGFAWLDVKSLVKWTGVDKGAEQVVDLIAKVIKLVEP